MLAKSGGQLWNHLFSLPNSATTALEKQHDFVKRKQKKC